MRIFLIGFMGSGKTFWGQKLGEKLGLPFFDLDQQVVSHEGKTIPEIFAEQGEEYFREAEKQTLHIITESHESFVMSTGGGAPCYFNNIEYMNSRGSTVWLNTAHDILFERLVKEKATRPLLSNLTDDQLHTFIYRKFADRRIYYEQARVIVDEEPLQLEVLIKKIFHA